MRVNFKIDQRLIVSRVAEYLEHCKSYFQAAVIQLAVGETKFGKCEKYFYCLVSCF